MKEMEKAYEPGKFEDKIYADWEASGLFNPDVCVEKGVTNADAPSFSMVLPPPNVTGTLHMGHAVMLAVQDLMTRYHRMKGDRTLWLPGTDHAAVATESKVEKLLIEGGMEKPKDKLGREDFLKEVEKFAQESHDTIVGQAKKMGSSMDWSREAYTLDHQRNKAVKTVFKKMYDDGLIYRGYRVVNWSVRGQSTCSDDELVHVERPAKLYTFTYSKDFPIPIATTRPETKLGDTAVAVHPEGKWKQYIGQEFTVENFGGSGHTLKLKVFGDENVDDSFGTGALGVTTAHSPIDFEMYQKQKALGNDIGLIQVIGEDGKMTANAGEDYAGLTVKEAKEKLVSWLESEELLQAQEDIMQNVGTSDRFKDVVEPLPKTQWFIDVNKEFILQESQLNGIETGQKVTLKQLMQTAVRSGQIKILPERFEKTYFQWIDNLRDWCISRQIWFGHRIPVWYQGDEVYCDVEPPQGEGWQQDPDTLDTWFSSGLWTFSTLGYPEQTEDLKAFHPTSVLETGYDILFFWVARMVLMTTYTLGQIPFETVYLHGLVRDEKGRKMSKSLGNIINPLDMIEKYGTDATRLSLVIGGSPGNDMKLSEEKVAGYRNFTNKLWNISRFMLGSIDNGQLSTSIKQKPTAQTLADKWIMARLDETVVEVTDLIENYQFSLVGEKLRDYTWNDLADWYLEIAKIEGAKSDILHYILNTILRLWHPYMPYVTEAIWKQVYGEDEMLMVAALPKGEESNDTQVQGSFELLQKVIIGLRNVRGQYGIPYTKELSVYIETQEHEQLLREQQDIIMKMLKLSGVKIAFKVETSHSMISFVEPGMTVYVDLAGAVDMEKEKERLEKEIAQVQPYVMGLEKKLSNDSFVNNAPEEVVAKEKEKLSEAKEKLEKLKEQLAACV